MSAPRIAVIASLAIVVAALAVFGDRSTPPAEPSARPEASAPPAVASTIAEQPTQPTTQVRRARYRLHHDRRVQVGGQQADRLLVDGVWTRAPVPGSDAHTVRLIDARIEAKGAEPALAAIDAPVRLVHDGGRLAGLGFSRSTPPEARDVLTALATALWFTPGDGARWAVVEEDQNGRYEATYTRLDADTVRRTRRYLALRDGAGWNPRLAERIAVTGGTTYTFDADGLAGLVVDEQATFSLDGVTPWTVVDIDIELTRLGFDAADAPVGPVASIDGPRHHVEGDPTEIDRQRLDGRTVADLLADLPRVAGLPRSDEAAAEARVRMLLQLESAARSEPGAVAAMAAAVAEARGSKNHTGLIASALAQAGTAEATAALVDLMGAGLEADHGRYITTAAGLSRHPTDESFAALGAQLDDPALGNSAALALGNSVRTAGETDAAASAVDSLLDRFAHAEGIDRMRALRALANSGSPRALPILEEALGSVDPKVAEAAAYGLRFIEGEPADALLTRLVTGPGSVSLRSEAVRAAAHRDPAVWRPILELLLADSAEGPLRQRIEQVLRSWS